MNHCKFFGTIAFILCTSPCLAGELKASDIEIVAVTPRSPDVKPYAMAIKNDGHRPAMHARNGQEASVARGGSLDTALDELATADASFESRPETSHNPIPIPRLETCGCDNGREPR